MVGSAAVQASKSHSGFSLACLYCSHCLGNFLEKERYDIPGRGGNFLLLGRCICHLPVGQSSTACPLHAPFLRKCSFPICARGRRHFIKESCFTSQK